MKAEQEVKAPRWRWVIALLGIVGVIVPILQFWYVNLWVALGIVQLVTMAATAALIRVNRRTPMSNAVVLLAAFGVLSELLWLTSRWYWFAVAGQILAVIVAFVGLGHVWITRPRGPVSGSRRVARMGGRAVGGALAVVAAIVSAGVLLTAVTPVPLTSALQAGLGYGNSFEADGPLNEKTVTDRGDGRISNIRYGTEYANSYLDAYIVDNDSSVPRPTYVYVHGGGWIVGGKASGDPAAGATGAFNVISDPMLEAGYNVVSVGYGLAPGADYPEPVKQLSQAMAFLQDHGGGFGIDMSQVVIAGASAGGQIIGQFANIQTNPDYAAEVGIEPVMTENLKAVVFDSAALDLSRVSEPQSPEASAAWLYTIAARTYLGTSEEKRDEADITSNVSASFPATFIADGNTATFPDQAEGLHARLDELGVPNELKLYSKEQAVIGHGFMASPSQWTNDYNAAKLGFLEGLVR
jgi:acetyl esterase/lipase